METSNGIPSQTNGHTPTIIIQGQANVGNETVQQIVSALEIIHDPRSTNQRRKEAGDFLEQAKAQKDAPFHGYTLAIDRSQPAVVRHFALGLIEHAIRYNWADYEIEDSRTVRGWIIQLAQGVKGQDPSYVRNKVAQLWVEVAKRSWADDWMDMDQLLLTLWQADMAQQDLCLHIMESLIDDVFAREDSTAGVRANILHKACLDIFTPQTVLVELYPERERGPKVRCDDQGWLPKLVGMLSNCLDNIENPEAEALAAQVLTTLKACMLWTMPKAITEARVVDQVGRAMMCGKTQLQMTATECLSSLFSRSLLEDGDFQSIVCPMYYDQTVNELRKILQSIHIDPADIDEDRYLYLKRFSELVSNLAIFIEERFTALPADCNIANFMQFLYEFATHESLTITLPIINGWARILRKDKLSESSAIQPLLAPLLEICKTRLLRYEQLPEDSALPPILYLQEDIEGIPERHVFLGNYRRFLCSIIESMVRRKPVEGLTFILQQVDVSMTAVFNEEPPFQIETYTKNSGHFLRLDALFSVVEAALKGYLKWNVSTGEDPDFEVEENEWRTQVQAKITQWCENLLAINFQDPLVKKRVVQLLVAFSTTALEKQADLMLKVLEYVLLARPADYLPNASYNDSVKDLQSVCTSELQRLAIKMPDHLMIVYDALEQKIKEIITNEHPDERHEMAYHTFLFTISHRTNNIDPAVRQARLDGYLGPIRDRWTSPELTESLSTFDGFCRLMGLDQVQQYMSSRRVNEIKDFSSMPLDEEGQALQAALTAKYKLLPLRITKAFLAVSTEKLPKSTAAYRVACQVWHDKIPVILPNLLKFLSYAHAFHNPDKWTNISPELHPVMKKVLTDRFWQSGISSGSRDQFYENVTKTKSTMEGFASSIRGTVRTVRESCYSILWAMSRLDIHFYGFDELPGPLALALFADAHTLSSHQMTVLLNMSRYIIDECPVQIRQNFLTPFLATLFMQIDRKVSAEWKELNELGLVSMGDDKLAEEMKEESVLRQLTYTAVLLVAQLLDPARIDPVANQNGSITEDSSQAKREGQMREFILSSDVILEPLIGFCTHVIGMRDSRCCGVIVRVFRSIVPEFAEKRPEIREFMCREVFMASINSIHDDYFVDVQKDLAQLIVQIYLLYSPHSTTPRMLLSQLPGLTERKIETFVKKVGSTSSVRVQRSLMLELLDGLRGVALSEKGKVVVAKKAAMSSGEREKEKERKLMVERRNEVMERSPDLGGVADMFG